MASQKLAKVVITANATTAKKVLEEIDKLVEKYTKDVNDLRAAGQANSAECKKAEKVLQSLSQVQRDNIEDTKRLGEVIKDLSNTKLRDLRRAVGAGKSALSALTGSDADMQKAEKIREQMTQVMRQVKLLEGEYVNIGEGIKDVEHQSDKWLDKAIKQQKEYAESIKYGTVEHARQANILKQLEAEQTRRNGKMSYSQATNVAQNAVSNWSYNQLKQAQQVLQQHRDATVDKTLRNADVQMLTAVNTRLAELDAKFKEVQMSASKLQQILNKPQNASINELEQAIEYLNQEMRKLPSGSAEVVKMRKQIATLKDAVKDTAGAMAEMNVKMKSDAQSAMSKVNNGGMISMSKNDLEASRKAMMDYQNTVVMGGKEWNDYGDAIAKVEARLKSFQKVEDMSAEQAKIITKSDPTKPQFTEGEWRQAINTLKELQAAEKVGSAEWKNYGEQIDIAQRKLDLITGKSKDITAGIGDIDNRTDEWIVSAKKQLKDYIASLDTVDQNYKDQIDLLKRLEAEEKRRAEAKSITKAEAVNRLANVDDFKESEVKEAIAYMKKLRDEVELGDEEWDKYQKSIANAEKKMQELKDYYKYMSEDRAMDVAQNVGKNREEYVRQAIDSLKQLQTHTDVGSEKWKEYQRTIESAEKALVELKDTSEKFDVIDASRMARKGTITRADENGNAVERQASLKEMQQGRKVLVDERDKSTDLDAVKQYNEEIKLLDDRIKSLSGTIEKATIADDRFNEILAGPKEAKATVEELRKSIERLNKEYDGMEAGSEAAKTNRKQFENLNKILKGTESNVVDVEDVLKRMKTGKASVDELKQAYKQLEDELNTIKNTTGESYVKHRVEMQKLRKEIDAVSESANKQGGVWKTAMHNLVAYVGLFGAFNLLKEKITEVINLNFKYSDQLTNIRKVSGMAMEDVNKLATKLAKIDTRTSVEQLSNLAYAGAKLGIGKYGVDGLNQFVKAADQINVSIGEEMGDEALPALAKMTETMGLIKKMGVEKSILATGSAMFKLSSTSTATSGNITEFAKRLTGVARTAGITMDQLLALGSAADSMMLMPEVASTAMGRFITALQKNHNLIEKDLDIPEGTINKLYSAGKAMDAIVLVLEKTKKKGNMNALGDIFKDFGSEGQRLIQSMVTMSKNVDMLKDHLYTSEEAFKEATAVTEEYDMQQESAAGILERANNMWNKAFMNPDGVDMVKEMAEMWYEMSSAMTSNIPIATSLRFILSSLLEITKMFIMALPGLLIGLGVGGVLGLIGKLYTGSLALARAIVSVKIAFQGLNVVAKGSWIGVIVGGVASLVTALAMARKSTDDVVTSTRSLKDAYADALSEVNKLESKMRSYKSVLMDANTSQEQRERYIAKFNSEYRQYLSKLDLEIKTVNDLAQHYNALAREVRNANMYRLQEEAVNEQVEPLRKVSAKKERNVEEDINKWLGAAHDRQWVREQADNGRDATWIYRKIFEDTLPGGRWDSRSGGYVYQGKSRKYDQLLADLKDYIRARRAETSAEAEVRQTFGNLKYEPYEEPIGTLENEAPDKDAEKAAKAAAREAAKEKRIELKDAEADAKAIIDKIKAYYELQISEVIKLANDTGLGEQMKQNLTDTLTTKMNEALEAARLAISGNKNNFEEISRTMINDMVEPLGEDGTNQSSILVDKILNVDTKSLFEKIATLSKDLNKPESALLDQIVKNAVLNEKANATQENKILQARRKQELEDNYTGKVQYDYQNIFDQFGFSEFTGDQMRRFQDGADEAKKLVAKRTTDIFSTFETARKNLAALYATNGDRESVLTLLYGKDYKERLEGSEIPGLLKLQGEDFRLFYETLINYSNDYTEAQRKASERIKKIFEFMWDNSAQSKAFTKQEQELKRQTSIYGTQYTSWKQRFGMADTDSPAVQQAKNDVAEAKAKLETLKKYTDDADVIREQEKVYDDAQLAYTDALVEQMKQRIQLLQQLVEPVEDFGTAMGEAFGTMIDDAESGREAIGNALKAMIQSYGKMMIEMVKAQMMQKVQNHILKGGTGVSLDEDDDVKQEEKKQEKLIDIQDAGQKAMSSMLTKAGKDIFKKKQSQKKKEEQLEQESQDEQGSIVEEGQSAQLDITEMMGEGIANSIVSVGQKASAAKKTQAATDASTTMAETQVETTAGIAGGAAKTIGKLGYWGIPLVAVITALLNGLLSFAMSQFSNLFGGGSSSSDTTSVNTKLVSGMLTYDSGNVGTLSPYLRKRDSGTTQDLHPYADENGNIYWATEDNTEHKGVSLVKSPTATTINGQPSLVAENGPELVIGRETTKAMMQNNPDLLRTLYAYDRNHSGRIAYDAGNLSSLSVATGDGTVQGSSTASLSSNSSAVTQMDEETKAMVAGISQMLPVLMQRLNQPIKATIDMYGRNQLYDSMQKATKFMKGR